MPRFNHHAFTLLITLVAIHVHPISAAMHPFQEWYPEWGFIFDRIIRDNCSSEYEFYLHGSVNKTYWDEHLRWLGTGSNGGLVVPLVNCILDYSSEIMKSGMAAANVVLGLTPTILATLGSGIDETSMLSIIGRRPFLALCLTAGSPAVVPIRLFQYRKVTEALDDRKGRLKPLFFAFWAEAIILVVEHLLVFAAIGNIAHLGYELGSRVTLVFAPHLTYLVLVWIFMGTFTHLLAAIALGLRIKIKETEIDDSKIKNARRGDPKIKGVRRNGLVWRIRTWITPWETNRKVTFAISPETATYTILSGFISLYTTAHILFGTLVFSSMLFISVRDSIPVIARFLASVIMCRIVLMYELARLRHLCHTEDKYKLFEQSDEKDDEEGDGEGDAKAATAERRRTFVRDSWNPRPKQSIMDDEHEQQV
ncbi:Fc.00g043490.m01.CDS01 [Cosmosporella sp. VM-42]